MPSSEIEANIILKGCKQAEQVHGIRYKRFVGDGNGSVYPTLIDNVTGCGRYIEELECANYACNCYRSGLEKLVQVNPRAGVESGLAQMMRCRLTSAACCTMKIGSQEPDMAMAVKLLECDLHNGPYHCFGRHEEVQF